MFFLADILSISLLFLVRTAKTLFRVLSSEILEIRTFRLFPSKDGAASCKSAEIGPNSVELLTQCADFPVVRAPERLETAEKYVHLGRRCVGFRNRRLALFLIFLVQEVELPDCFLGSIDHVNKSNQGSGINIFQAADHVSLAQEYQ